MFYIFLQKRITNYEEYGLQLFMVIMILTSMRCISFSIDYISMLKETKAKDAPSEEKKEDKETSNTVQDESDNSAKDNAVENIRAEGLDTGNIQNVSAEEPAQNKLENQNMVTKNCPEDAPPSISIVIKEPSVDQDETKDCKEDSENMLQPKVDSEMRQTDEISKEAADQTKGVEEITKTEPKELGTTESLDDAPLVPATVHYSAVDFLLYCTYLPLAFTGPMVTYNDFYEQVSQLLLAKLN